MDDGSSPGRRPSPDGKPSRRSSSSSHKGRKLPSPVKKEPVLQNGSQEMVDVSCDEHNEQGVKQTNKRHNLTNRL